MGATFYYIFPFGENADDLTAIPSNPAIDGSVSYHDGWTDPYEFDLNTNPSALPIPRGQMNQLLLDITTNLQEYQQFGSPNWIAPSDNGGVPFPYPIYARVYYLGNVYENQVALNVNVPGTDTTWLLISGNAQGVVVGQVIDFAGTVVPSGYLFCDGTAYSRTTYSALLNKISFTQNGTTTNTMNTLTGLSSTVDMYVGMAIEGTNIPSGTTVASITSGTAIRMSQNATGSATVPVTFFSWGNGDGSTTFNVPDMRRCVSMGSGGTPSTVIPPGIGAVVGQGGGEEMHAQSFSELATHNHQLHVKGTAIPFLPSLDTNASGGYNLSTAFSENAGSGQAANIIQPSRIMKKCIKF
jgi:microcystin-dependent protein